MKEEGLATTEISRQEEGENNEGRFRDTKCDWSCTVGVSTHLNEHLSSKTSAINCIAWKTFAHCMSLEMQRERNAHQLLDGHERVEVRVVHVLQVGVARCGRHVFGRGRTGFLVLLRVLRLGRWRVRVGRHRSARNEWNSENIMHLRIIRNIQH